MKLYYGSETNIILPEYGKGKLTNDYGLGFYMTPSYEMVKLWASRSVNGGYLITYDLNLEDLLVLKLDDFGEENVLKWISILTTHRFNNEQREMYKNNIDWLKRKFPVNLDGYDVVIGYRADDSYFRYSLEFVRNNLSLEVLSNAMKIGKLGTQYVAISKKAFSHLRFIKSEKVNFSNTYSDFQKKALDDFHKLRIKDSINNTFLRDLMRKYGE